MKRSAPRLHVHLLEDRTTPTAGPITPSSPDPTGGQNGDPAIFGGGIGYQFTNWPADPLDDIALTSENTFPIVGPRGQAIRAGEDWIIRDPFPVTDLDGKLARVGGWYIGAGLATARDDAQTAPNGVSTLREFRYIISQDGVNWQEGGLLLSAEDGQPVGLGDQLFSGDFRYDVANNRVLLYYTPVQGFVPDQFVQGVSGRNMRQEIAIATATPVPAANGLTFTNYVDHGVVLRPDGNWYVTPEDGNTETEVYAFRDPYLYRDPETGTNYLLFAANWGRDQTVGYPEGAETGDQRFPDAGPHDVVAGRPRNDGVVGVAVATDDSLLNWRLLPPIFGGVGVNEQLELPHIVFEDGRHYLLMSTHNRTFIGDLKYEYPEGFYGFVADDFQGPYRPVNGTSLIAANPPQDELQTYAWKAVDLDGGRATLLSFINKGNSGTISPAVSISFDGDRVVLDGFQAPLANLPQPTVLAFGLTPTAPLGSTPPATGNGGGNNGGGSNGGGSNGGGDGNNGNGTNGLSITITVVVSGTQVIVRDANGGTAFQVTPFPGFDGTFETGSGDVNGDGTDDLVVGAGNGGAPHVKVFDGKTGGLLSSFFAYENTFRGGVHVAVGDVQGTDGRAEVIAGAGASGGPRVTVFDGTTGQQLSSFFAYESGFRGGVFVGTASLSNYTPTAADDGPAGRRQAIVTGAGPGAGPRVRVLDVRSGRPTELSSFFAFDQGFLGGVRLTSTRGANGVTTVSAGQAMADFGDDDEEDDDSTAA